MPLSRENLNCRFVAVARATEVYSGPYIFNFFVREVSLREVSPREVSAREVSMNEVYILRSDRLRSGH